MTFALYLGGALALSATAVLAFGTALEFERRWHRLMVPGLYLLLILLNTFIPTLILGRDLSSPSEFVAPGAVGKWIWRLLIVTAFGMCVLRIMAGAFSRENRAAGGAALLVAFAVYFLTGIVLSSTLGAHPQFRHYVYYAPLLFCAVYASRTHDPEIAVRFAKVGLFIFLAASWIVTVVAPEMAVERYYRSWIPGVTWRFWGLAGHANAMGQLALVYLLLTLHQPFERRWLHHLGLLLGVAAFLAAQSKTAWGAAALALPSLLMLRSGAWRVAALSLAGVGAVVSGALLVLLILGVSLEGLEDTRQGYEALTLTDRDQVWALAVREWMRNPFFGYGIAMWDWDSAFTQQNGIDIYSAHNQFLQELSRAGAVGFIGLVVYLGTVSLYALRAHRASRGLSVALLLLVLISCMTESPLSIDSLFAGGAFGRGAGLTLAHLLLFHLALSYGSDLGRRS